MDKLIPNYDKDWVPEGYVKISSGPNAGLLCRAEYLSISDDEKNEICNGIGASEGLSKHFPNTIWFLDCTEAGNIHDYDYYIGGTSYDKQVADTVFLFNLYALIQKGSWLLRGIRRDRANAYYLALRACGGKHYNFK